jgi:ribosome-binding factor A
MLPYKRSERVRKLLQHEICKILREIKDPKIGFVTIIDVELTDDLTESKVYYSVLGDEEVCSDTKDGLNRAAAFIRRRLGPELNLRKVPTIQFVFDDSVKKAERIFSLLNKISSESEKSK